MDHATTLDLLHARRFGDDIRLIYAASPDPP
jgi:hypothetical protein